MSDPNWYSGKFLYAGTCWSELLLANLGWTLTNASVMLLSHPSTERPAGKLRGSATEMGSDIQALERQCSDCTGAWTGGEGGCCQRLHCLTGQHGFTCSAWFSLHVWTIAPSNLNCPGRCGWGLPVQVKV